MPESSVPVIIEASHKPRLINLRYLISRVVTVSSSRIDTRVPVQLVYLLSRTQGFNQAKLHP